jgi:hypothetical protein
MDSQYIIGKSPMAMYSPGWGSRPAEENAAGPAMGAGGSAAKIPALVSTASNVTPQTGEAADGLYAASLSKRGRGPETTFGDFTFDDFLDIINPLQHIPIVNLIYREATGDKISGTAQIIGSTLLGGPLGMVSGVISAILEQETGKGTAETAIALLTGIGREDEKGGNAPGAAPAAATLVAEAAREAPSEEAQDAVAVAENDEATEVAAQEETQIEAPAPALAPVSVAAPAPAPTAVAQAAPQTGGQNNGLQETARIETGERFFPLAGVHRLSAAATPRMPVSDAPDVQLKSFNLQHVSRPATALAAAQPWPQIQPQTQPQIQPGAVPPQAERIAGITPMIAREQAQQILNLDAAPAANIAAILPPASGNPLPPQLIQDMMLMNLQKYQNGGGDLGAFTRGANVNVDG